MNGGGGGFGLQNAVSLHTDEWLSGQPDVLCVRDDFIVTAAYTGTCEAVAE